MNENKLIKEENKFEEILALINKMFNYEQRLPDQVFKTSFQKTIIFDFDYAMSHGFWNELEQLARLSSDSAIIMAVLDPDPVSYYYKEFSMYNWCVLPKETTADEYWDIIEQGPEGSPADAILFNSEVIVWLSESMKWAMWAERSYGICILGFNENELRDYESEASFTMHQAITDLISLNFKRYTVPDEVVLKLKDFYNKN